MKLLKGFGLAAITSLALGISGCASYHHPEHYTSDHSINSRVKDGLARSPSSFRNVIVRTHDGIVELHGYVETPQQQAEAEQLAANVPGVRQVIDNLRITTPLAPTGQVPIIRRNYP
jgi:osmotically-inducible protein OsmY